MFLVLAFYVCECTISSSLLRGGSKGSFPLRRIRGAQNILTKKYISFLFWCYVVPLIYLYHYTYTTIDYLNYPDLLLYWPRSSAGRASVDLFRRSWVETPPRSNFLTIITVSRVLRGSTERDKKKHVATKYSHRCLSAPDTLKLYFFVKYIY